MGTTRDFRNVCLVDSFRATLKLDPLISESDNTASNEKRVGLIRPCIWRMQTDILQNEDQEHVTLFKAYKRFLCLFEMDLLCYVLWPNSSDQGFVIGIVFVQCVLSDYRLSADGHVPDFPLAPEHLTSANQSVPGGSPCVPIFSLRDQ